MADKDPSATPGDKPVAGATRTDPAEPARTHRANPRLRGLRGGGGGSMRDTRRRVVNLIATIVSVITTVVVLILAVHILFSVFEANTANGLVSWTADRAESLAWQFKDVFEPEDPKVGVTVNYGLAALVYLVIGRVLAALLRRAA